MVLVNIDGIKHAERSARPSGGDCRFTSDAILQAKHWTAS